jgi:enhancing lycopene biosynthesis protein 2
MKKVAVILSGCGVYDGSEIHEAVLTLLHLDKRGARVSCFAPSIPQAHVVNHLEGAPAEGESRNVLVESARIARGAITDLATLDASDFDALVIPGGFGAAKNLCTFAFDGADCTIHDGVEKAIKAFHSQKKPIGIICIAPVMAAKLLGSTVTIGCADDVATAIQSMGGTHQQCEVDAICVDEANNVISCPAYMYDARISEVSEGIEKLIETVVARA